MRKKEDLTGVLSDLLKINNDRIGMYRKAIRDINEHDLKVAFKTAIDESRKIQTALALEIFKRDGLPDVDGTTTAGMLYRLWLDFKEIFVGRDYNSTIAACQFSEYCVHKAYRQALHHEDISLEIRQILNDQIMALRKSHKGLRTHRVTKTSGSFYPLQGTMVEARGL